MIVTITVYSDSVLGNTANDTAGFSSTKYIIFLTGCDQILAILSMGVDEFFLSMVVFKAYHKTIFRAPFEPPLPRPPKTIMFKNKITY